MIAAFSGANAGITRGYAMNHDKVVRDLQAAGRAGALDDPPGSDGWCRTFAEAYDREDAAQRGEPNPWNIDDPGDIGGAEEWRRDRIACVRAGLDAVWKNLPRTSRKSLGGDVSRWCSAEALLAMALENLDETEPADEVLVGMIRNHFRKWETP